MKFFETLLSGLKAIILSHSYSKTDSDAKYLAKDKQAQSDWKTTNSKDPSFIKNKPTLIGKEGSAEGAEIFNDYENSEAYGEFSHAEGYRTTATGNYSHAEGYYTQAQTKSQHVQGEYNKLDAAGSAVIRGRYAHIVGNGTSTSARSNAHTLDWSGNAWFAGEVYVGGTSQDDGEKLAKMSDIDGYATESYVDDKVSGITHPISSVNGKTGVVVLSASDVGAATESYVDGKVSSVVNSAPELLNTLDELAQALGDDPNFATTVTELISKKADTEYVDNAIANISIDVDSELSDTSENPVQNKVIKTELGNYLTKKEMYIPLIDSENGFTYFVSMKNGQLVSEGKITSIEITSIPTKTEYYEGDTLDTTGMIVTATMEDGTTQEIHSHEWNNIVVSESPIVLTYEKFGETFFTSFELTIIPIEDVLTDFQYIKNDDGTYTLTAWKGTLNGEPSTELVVPDSNLIQI